jgi:hypothetical protein
VRTHSNKRRVLVLGASLTLGSLLTACDGSPTAAPSSSTTTTTTSTTTPRVDGPNPTTTTTTEVSIPLSAITDPGLPSTVGPGPLKSAQVKKLMQYFETNVAQAYATGNAAALKAYLAGSMLTGNTATINVLNTQSQHNVYSITVKSVSIDNNETDRVVFDMTGNMTADYFEDTKTNQPVADELPGPSAVDFLVFFDFNPANHTWYWTGEQNESDASDGGTGS